VKVIFFLFLNLIFLNLWNSWGVTIIGVFVSSPHLETSSLKQFDKTFKSKKNDENAWVTSLNEKEVFDILKKLNLLIGTDIAASGFFKRKE